jgi:hypothetical protein
MDIQMTEAPQPAPLFDQAPMKSAALNSSSAGQAENALLSGGPGGVAQKAVPNSIDQSATMQAAPSTTTTGNQVNLMA